MAHNILILGASYGSLLGTKLLMAGHNVTLVCREETAKLINEKGTEVRIKLKGEDEHRTFRSKDLPGRLDARDEFGCRGAEGDQCEADEAAGELERVRNPFGPVDDEVRRHDDDAVRLDRQEDARVFQGSIAGGAV